jgi:DNA-binding MarR family transcriptional regulator
MRQRRHQALTVHGNTANHGRWLALDGLGRSIMENGRAKTNRLGVDIDRDIDRTAIVAAGLAMMDEQGLRRCDFTAIADRLGIAQAALRGHFPDHDDLLAAMGRGMTEASPIAIAGKTWRDQLTRRALAARQTMLSRRDGSILFAHLPLPLPLGGSGVDAITTLCAAGFTLADAQAAVMLIDRLTIGWVLVEQAQPDAAELQLGFESQLGVVIAGIAASLGAGLATQDNRQSRFQSDLWVFLRDARESANISFSRTIHLNELDRRILLLLQAQGNMTLAAISTSNGVDKAQVSRAIKRLNESALVTRGGIRSPICLSHAGRLLADRLLRQAELRNRELAFGITDDQLVSLFGVLDTLLSRAVTLFEQERKLSAANQKLDEQVDFQDLVNDGLPDENGIAVDRSRILPPFITLCSYMLRGGALAHKRRTGLSNFETWVLVEVCRQSPISWPQLVIALSRDQSQAGRTVNHLIDSGLIERTGKPGRRHGFFAPTEEGRRIYEIIDETAAKRSAFLFQGIPAPQLEGFMTAFAVLVRNAEVQVAREKAIQEMDRT